MSVSYWLDKNKNNNHIVDCDIVIIGGGIAGLSSAYWLNKEDPDLKICIVEKNELGSGATGRNAGFITCGSVEHFNRLVGTYGQEKALEIWRFSEVNLQLLKEHIIEAQESDYLFEHNGSFSLASTESELTELKKSADLMHNLNINVEVLNQNAIEKRLNVVNFVGGIKYIDDASIDPIQLINGISKKLGPQKQVHIFEHNEVFKIEKEDNGFKSIYTNQNTFKSPIVVYATNGYSPLLESYFDNKIYPTRAQILATEPVDRFMEGPCYANFVLDYFRQLPTGQLIIGGFRQMQKDTEVGYADQITPVIQEALEDFIQNHIPPLKNKKITHRWTGIMGFSADGQPMIGSLPTDPQTYFLGGFTAHGLGLAFHTGRCLADLMFGREVPEFINSRRF